MHDLRSQFPVLERLAYLNAGTEGPIPARASEAVHARIDLEVNQGRCGRSYFEGDRRRSLATSQGYRTPWRGFCRSRKHR